MGLDEYENHYLEGFRNMAPKDELLNVWSMYRSWKTTKQKKYHSKARYLSMNGLHHRQIADCEILPVFGISWNWGIDYSNTSDLSKTRHTSQNSRRAKIPPQSNTYWQYVKNAVRNKTKILWDLFIQIETRTRWKYNNIKRQERQEEEKKVES